MTADGDRFTWALAAYLRSSETAATTHADRDLTARAFRAGWEARGNPHPRGRRADKEGNR